MEQPQAQREMPSYRCHKVVHALKIKRVLKHASASPEVSDAQFEASPYFRGGHLLFEDGFAPIPFDAAWYRKHSPHDGGYYVVYPDGYASFSPAEAFEGGYTRSD